MDSFAICRSFGMQGVHVEERDKKLVFTEFYEHCLAQDLGCLCVGDTIVSIDGELLQRYNIPDYRRDDNKNSSHAIQGEIIIVLT